MSELCGIQQWLVNIQMCILQQNLQKIVRQRCSKKLQNTYRFRDEDNNKFCLMLQKVVYPCDKMGGCQKSNETSVPEKKAFCDNLPVEDIMDGDYKYGKHLLWSTTSEQYTITDRCIFKFVHQKHQNIWPWICLLSVDNRISKANMFEEYKSGSGIADGCRYVANDTKVERHQKWDVSHNS